MYFFQFLKEDLACRRVEIINRKVNQLFEQKEALSELIINKKTLILMSTSSSVMKPEEQNKMAVSHQFLTLTLKQLRVHKFDENDLIIKNNVTLINYMVCSWLVCIAGGCNDFISTFEILNSLSSKGN